MQFEMNKNEHIMTQIHNLLHSDKGLSAQDKSEMQRYLQSLQVQDQADKHSKGWRKMQTHLLNQDLLFFTKLKGVAKQIRKTDRKATKRAKSRKMRFTLQPVRGKEPASPAVARRPDRAVSAAVGLLAGLTPKRRSPNATDGTYVRPTPEKKDSVSNVASNQSSSMSL